jgi:hypothetical protein
MYIIARIIAAVDVERAALRRRMLRVTCPVSSGSFGVVEEVLAERVRETSVQRWAGLQLGSKPSSSSGRREAPVISG